MKTLFVSDLDGTLLNDNAYISDYSKAKLNELIEKDIFFTVATARTIASVAKILDGININAPVILMNGTAIFDMRTKSYVCVESINKIGKEHLFNTLKKFEISGFLYCIDNGYLSTYYEDTVSPVAKKFVKERVKRYNKKFKKITHFSDCKSRNVVYFSICDKLDKLKPAYEQLVKCDELHVEFYTDNYNEGFMYLEVCSKTVSKYNAVKKLKEIFEFDKIIGFGDNLNDLPLFDACDESYAVENGNPEAKAKANGIIKSNNDNGVVGFMASYIKNF